MMTGPRSIAWSGRIVRRRRVPRLDSTFKSLIRACGLRTRTAPDCARNRTLRASSGCEGIDRRPLLGGQMVEQVLVNAVQNRNFLSRWLLPLHYRMPPDLPMTINPGRFSKTNLVRKRADWPSPLRLVIELSVIIK